MTPKATATNLPPHVHQDVPDVHGATEIDTDTTLDQTPANETIHYQTTTFFRELQEQLGRVEANHHNHIYDTPEQQKEVLSTLMEMQTLLSERMYAHFSRDAIANEQLRRQQDH